MSMTSPKSVLPLAAVGVFLAAHVVVPLVWGDLYPFTSAPMFRDKPVQYCNYHVFTPDGIELPQENWLVQRIYDGNPVGYGVGVTPPAVMEQEFGIVHEEREVREHIHRQYRNSSSARPSSVTVEQRRFGLTNGGTIELLEARSWKIAQPTP